jgi:catechol-2,3-dioxygenase
MVGQLRSVVLDCPNPSELASFYEKLLGAERLAGGDDTWVVIVANGTRLAFQRSGDYRPPTFPDPHGSQQFHLDVLVEDVEEAEQRVLELGARSVQKDTGSDFRVYTDPVGHPFCLVWQS